MNLSGKGAFASDTKLTTLKSTSLNPHAAEFVPFSLQSPSRILSSADSFSKGAAPAGVTLGKSVLDRSESSVSNNSDDEVRQYWRQQLPDDITPDFNVLGEDVSQGLSNLSLSGLSMSNANETSRFSTSAGSDSIFQVRQELSPYPVGGNRFTERVRAPLSYSDDPSADCFQSFSTNSWDEQTTNNDRLIANVTGEPQLNVNMGHGFLPNILNEKLQMDYTDVEPLEFLSSQFPGFSAESLGEVYFANGGNLNLTIKMLTQLELQIDGGLNQIDRSNVVSSPNLSALDFPALSATEGQNGVPKFTDHEVQQNANSYRPSNNDNMVLFRSSSSIPSRGHIDFASAVRKMASQDSGIWKYNRNSSSDVNVGSSRSSHVLARSYSSGQDRGISLDRLQPRASSRAPPVWLETGEAVANMYSEVREDARDHARLRNAYFEQARQAYLIGNKALAKELSVKGQLHNMQMKEAHGKAQESIYRQRNPEGAGMQVKGGGHERIIDLHGLHVNEAIHVLKLELAELRNAAEQRLQVYICVGTGHHTRGSRTPARLPIAVQRYLLEEEGLDYSEPQPGLLRVVIY